MKGFVWATALLSLSFAVSAAQTTPGVLSGQFTVTDSGAAAYTIPIAVPVGAGGVAPQVSLVYSSHAGRGIAGVGWTVSAVDSITRCQATIAQDGFVAAPDFSSSDRYCLGGQRLVPVRGSVGQVGAEYRTEVDSYAKIVSLGGTPNRPHYFRVWEKSGDILTYGSLHDANFPRATTNVQVWNLARREDRYGNYIDYEYTHSNDHPQGGNSILLTRILYSQNQQITPEQAAYSVRFEYEQAPAAHVIYQAGARIVQDKRLRKIWVERTGSGGNVLSVVRTYTLTYSPDTQLARSYLASVQECTAAWHCYPSTEFRWKGSVESSTQKKSAINTFVGGSYDRAILDSGRIKVGDFNGDGLSDIYYVDGWGGYATDKVYLSEADGTFGQPRSGVSTYVSSDNNKAHGTYSVSAVRVIDLNRDGFDDIYIINRGAPAADTVYINRKGQGWDGPLTGPATYISPWDIGEALDDLNRVNFIEANGDGIPDIYFVEARGGALYASVFVGRGDGTFHPRVNGALHAIAGGKDTIVSLERINFADLNADGLTDIYIVEGWHSSAKDTIYINQGNPSVGQANWTPGNGAMETYVSAHSREDARNSIKKYKLADFNGDGAADLYEVDRISSYLDPPFHTVVVEDAIFLNDGTGRFNSDVMIDGAPSGDAHSNDLFILDYNGDGLSDIYWPRGSNSAVPDAVYLNAGNGSWVAQDSASTYIGSRAIDQARLKFGDFNGDGLLDVYQMEGWGSFQLDSLYLQVGEPGFYVDQISTGIGERQVVEYQPLTNTSVYTKGCSAASRPEVSDVKSSLSVVKKNQLLDASDSPIFSTTYKYFGLCADRLGRGVLGFERVETENDLTGSTKIRTFSQDFPLTGLMMQSSSRDASGDLISTQTSSWQQTTFSGGGRFAVQELERTVADYEMGGSAPYRTVVTSHEWSAPNSMVYGQVDSTTITYFSGAETSSPDIIERLQYQYEPVSETDWKLGRLQSVRTVKEANGYWDDRLSTFKYSLQGAVIEEVIEPGVSGSLTKLHTYDGFGNKLSETLRVENEPDRTSSAEYSIDGRFKISETNALGHRTLYEFDDHSGVLLATEDPNGLRSVSVFDGFLRLESVTDPTGRTVRSEWGFCSDGAYQCHDSRAVFWKRSYTTATQYMGSLILSDQVSEFDAHEREVSSLARGHAGRWIVQTSLFGIGGRVDSTSVPRFVDDSVQFWVNNHFDVRGRLIKVEKPKNENSGQRAFSTVEHDGLSKTMCDGVGSCETHVEDASGAIVRASKTDGGFVEHTRDGYGNIRTTLDAEGNVWEFEYDLRGQKSAMNDPVTGRWTYEYNGFGELSKQTDANNDTTQIVYDRLGRKIRSFGRGFDHQWLYDTGFIGALTSESASGTSTLYTYDALGRLTRESKSIDGQTYVTEHEFDVIGRPQKLVYPTGYFLTYAYHSQYGYLEQVDDSFGAQLWKLQERDSFGRLTQVALGPIDTLKHYDAANGGLLSIISTGSEGETLQSLSFQWDIAGNLVSRHYPLLGNSTQESFAYDAAGRLERISKSWWDYPSDTWKSKTTSISYSAMGNITSKSDSGFYSYDSGENTYQLSGLSFSEIGKNTQFEYDGNGAIISGDGLDVAWNAFRKPDELRRTKKIPRVGGQQPSNYPVNCSFSDSAGSAADGQLVFPTTDGDSCVQVRWGKPTWDGIPGNHRYLLQWSKSSDFSSGVYSAPNLPQHTTNKDIVFNAKGYWYVRLVAYPEGQNPDLFANEQVVQGIVELPTNAFVYKGKHGDRIYISNTRAYVTDQDQDGVVNAFDQCASSPRAYQVDSSGCTKESNAVARFTYDANMQRAKQVQEEDRNGDGALARQTIHYVGGHYEKLLTATGTEHVFYVRVGGQLIASRRTTGATSKLQILLDDHLGSIETVVEVSDGSHSTLDQMSFDSFGRRRFAGDFDTDLYGEEYFKARPTTKGFTGHEMLDGLNLVHMNGRIYDPGIGRFLSPDPIIQEPTNPQSYNRYSYVFNNPLSYTDPSGFSGLRRIGRELRRWERDFRHEVRREDSNLAPILQVVIMFASSSCGKGAPACAAAGTALLGAAQGRSDDEIWTSAAVAAIGSYVSMSDWSAPVKVVASGAVTGTYAKLNGGSFKNGFGIGVLQGVAGSFNISTGEAAYDAAISALVGGTISEATGGKFANGAVTGAFAYALSSHRRGGARSLNKIKDGNATTRIIGLDGDGFATADEAALAIYADYDAEYLAAGANQELSGAIVKVGGRFYYTEPVVGGLEHTYRLTIANAPDSAGFAGTYHTHPAPGGYESFSPRDRLQVMRFERPYYLRAPSGGVFRLSPGQAGFSGTNICPGGGACLPNYR